jgi:transposase
MPDMDSYTQAAMERAMRVQEVMLPAMAKKISWWQAAEILGVSDRHMRRWRERYQEFGFRGLFDRRRGQRTMNLFSGELDFQYVDCVGLLVECAGNSNFLSG